jgi:hypothetical protein
METGYPPAIRQKIPLPLLIEMVPPSEIKWQVFEDWGLMKEAKDVIQCIIKFLDMHILSLRDKRAFE